MHQLPGVLRLCSCNCVYYAYYVQVRDRDRVSASVTVYSAVYSIKNYIDCACARSTTIEN